MLVQFSLCSETPWYCQKFNTTNIRHLIKSPSCSKNRLHVFLETISQNFTYNLLTNSILIFLYFYAPGLKGPPGASSVWIVCPSVHPSVRLSVRNSVPLINKVQYLKFGWSYSNQTWTVSSSKGCSHFTDITCPGGWGGVKIWDLEIFAIVWLCCPRGHPCFTNTCLVHL